MSQESELQFTIISENLGSIGHKDLLYPSFMSLILVTLPVLEQGEKLEHNQAGKIYIIALKILMNILVNMLTSQQFCIQNKPYG